MSTEFKRFIENNFNNQKYCCNMYTFARIIQKKGFKCINRSNDLQKLNCYSAWYRDNDGDVIEISIDSCEWFPRFWGKRPIPTGVYHTFEEWAGVSNHD